MTIWTPTRHYTDQQMERLQAWVAEMMTACEAQALELGISPEMIVGQAAGESDWGRAAIGHNIFGVKADASWHGPVLMQRTAEQTPDGSVYYITAPFRDYPSFKESIDDWLAFLKRNRNYAEAGVFTAHDDVLFAQALKRGQYATAVNYAEYLIQMRDSVRHFTASMTRSGEPPSSLVQLAVPAPPPPPRLLIIGSHGGDVKALQAALKTQGLYAGELDGQFGPMTAAAVRAFQAASYLVVDGIAGQLTQGALGLGPRLN